MKNTNNPNVLDIPSSNLYEDSSPFGRGLILTFIGLGIAISSPHISDDLFNPAFGWFVCAFGLLVATISLTVHCIRAGRHRGRVDVLDMAGIIHDNGYRVHSFGENSVRFFYDEYYLLEARCLNKDILVIEYVFEGTDPEDPTDSLVAAALAQSDMEVAQINRVRINGVDALSISVAHVGSSTYEFKKLLDVAPRLITYAHDSYLGFIDDIKRRRKLQSYEPIQYYF